MSEHAAEDATPVHDRDAVLSAISVAVQDFEDDLVALSAQQARRQRLDAVSLKHVDEAGAFLRTRPVPMKTRLVGTIGGFLLGAAASNVLTLVSSKEPSHQGIVLTLGFAVIGSAFVAAHAARDH